MILFGLLTLFPDVWDKISSKLNFAGGSNKFLAQGVKRGGVVGDVMIGAALGPIFTACSPTFTTVVATTFPVSYGVGLAYLITFVIGLAIPLTALAIYGQKFTSKIKSLSDPHGTFKKVIGVLFLVLGVAIILGWDKEIEAYLISQGFYDWQVSLEQWLSDR